jgi:ribosome-binding factor A
LTPALTCAARACTGLASSHGFLQARLAGELRMKNTPQLEFSYDESVERGMRIAELLRETGEEEPQ